ncbi:hypothetical protein ACHAXN_009772 [Cyclotella atomus]
MTSRIDELARRVLTSANWPNARDDAHIISPTPFLDELERALDIRLPPVGTINNVHVSGVRTCTVPSTSGHQKSGSSNCSNSSRGSHGKKSNENATTWSWTPSSNPNNTYTQDTPSSLEEYAPFTPMFYRCLGLLIQEANHPGSVALDTASSESGAATNPTAGADLSTPLNNTANTTLYTALNSLEQYSLPRMHEAVRLTRILLTLQEMHVDDEYKFIDRLLYYCEGNTLCKPQHGNDSSSSSNTLKEEASRTTDSKEASQTTKTKMIPILSSLFHHYTNLPQLEHGLHQLSRRYTALLPKNASDYWEYTSSFGNTSNNSDDDTTTRGEWTSSTSTTSFLGSRAVRIESYKSRLESELHAYIHGDESKSLRISGTQQQVNGGLVHLLSYIYRASDARLRGKIRKWMGMRLHTHALCGGSVSYSKGLGIGGDAVSSWCLGASFTAYFPLTASMAVGSSSAIAVGASGPISLTSLDGSGGMIQQHNPLGMENTSACGIDGLLQVLLLIIAGFQCDDNAVSSNQQRSDATRKSRVLKPSHENLLFEILIPLHRPSGMVLWRDQTALLELYHESLVKCIGVLLNMDPTIVGPVVGSLIHPDILPTEGKANTPKVVLLIHEIDTLIGTLQSREDEELEQCLSSFDLHIVPLAIMLCTCISSENSRVSERALQVFKNSMFKRLLKRNLDEVGPYCLRALCRCSSGLASWEVPWNPTVRKMTLLVLRELEEYYKEQGDDAFADACDETFSGYLSSQPVATPTATTLPSASKRAVIGSRPSDAGSSSAGNMTSLRSAMGSWRPPSQKSKVSRPSAPTGNLPKQPPSTITGVAPWALGASQSRGVAQPKAGSGQPPVTITGVVPWAIAKTPAPSPLPRSVKRPLPSKPSGETNSTIESSTAAIEEGDEESGDDDDTGEENNLLVSSAMQKVRSYMEKLKLPEDETGDGISSWAKSQMLESPVLLPNLKFHDLVFGQDLGTGAFSTVRYARQIVKDRTRSKWPEYAVKVVSTQKIEEMGYEQSINREIAILRLLSHPGISRLISSFRFRDGAYLVLEYASGGDLHTLLRKNGSLDHESTQFVIGSVAAALLSIHERGFVWADCKPENILIMESGHIKLTDFGACRPITEEAKALVRDSSKNLVQNLRDGDWKSNSHQHSKLAQQESDSPDTEPEDRRIEGTTAYLPPEVVLGAFPTAAADIWALGCVMFQCLSGRPPILEDTDELTAQKIVSFHLVSQSHDFFGEQEGSSTFNENEMSLIQRMLSRESSSRPSISSVAGDAYFDGIDIFRLHTKPAHQLDVGAIEPTADAKWTRRQLSTIWAPQPQAYNIDLPVKSTHKLHGSANDPIIEGDEVSVLFYSTQKAPLLAKIREH